MIKQIIAAFCIGSITVSAWSQSLLCSDSNSDITNNYQCTPPSYVELGRHVIAVGNGDNTICGCSGTGCNQMQCATARYTCTHGGYWTTPAGPHNKMWCLSPSAKSKNSSQKY